MVTRDYTDDAFQRGRTEERQRLARELHDGVLQSLANVALRLEGTRKWLSQTEKKPPREFQHSAEEIRQSIKEIREVLIGDGGTRGWKPGTLQQRLEAELREASKNAGIPIELKVSPAELWLRDAHLEREVFLATREAVRNMVRHSGASKADLTVTLNSETLAVSLTDNGPGFYKSRSARRNRDGNTTERHYGLKAMASRINELGGRISISSKPGLGTIVSLSVPIARNDRHRAPEGRRVFGKHPLAVAVGGAVIAAALAAAMLLSSAGEAELERVLPASIEVRSPTASGESALSSNPLEAAVSQYQIESDAMVTGGRPPHSIFGRLDLSAWDYKLIATQTREEDGRERRAFVYQHEKTKELLIAEEFPRTRIFHGDGNQVEFSGRKYMTYSDDGVYSVAWNEQDTLCIVTASLPEKKLLDLVHEITSEQLAGNTANQ